MRIVLATPLFPPDTAPAAQYAKELAARLAKDHEVTIVPYAYIPERVEGTRIAAVQKRQPIPLRLLSFFFTLLANTEKSDTVLAINGISTELPVLIVSVLLNRPYTLLMRDADARSSFLTRLAKQRAKRVISTFPPDRPEIHPLEERPDAAFSEFERAWQVHLTELSTSYGT